MLLKLENWFRGRHASTSDYIWCSTALPVALSLFLIAYVITALFLSSQVVTCLPARLYLGMLPLHIVTFGGVLAVLFNATDPGQRLKKLHLAPLPDFAGVIRDSLLMYFIIFPATTVVAGMSRYLARQLDLPISPPPFVRILSESPGVHSTLIITVSALIVAPVTEELLFRVTLYEAAAVRRFPAPGMLTSLAFALSHGLWIQTPAYFLLGAALQRLRGKTQTVWAPILLHALFNATSLLLLFAMT